MNTVGLLCRRCLVGSLLDGVDIGRVICLRGPYGNGLVSRCALGRGLGFRMITDAYRMIMLRHSVLKVGVRI